MFPLAYSFFLYILFIDLYAFATKTPVPHFTTGTHRNEFAATPSIPPLSPVAERVWLCQELLTTFSMLMPTLNHFLEKISGRARAHCHTWDSHLIETDQVTYQETLIDIGDISTERENKT